MWQSIHGMLQIEITSADPSAFLEILNENGISVFHIEPMDLLTIQCSILRSDYKKIIYLCKKYGNNISLLKKTGAYWWAGRFLQRPVLVVGMVLFLGMISFLPTRIFFFEVEGNKEIPDQLILEAAENCGIQFGVSRRKVRSEKMKNALLASLPELQWAGINTTGCRGIISVRERENGITQKSFSGISSMIAAEDGMVTSCTVTNGNAVCSVGQTVKKNQLLISPYVDCGLAIKVVSVEGEVYAQTNRKLTAVMPTTQLLARYDSTIKKRYYIIFGKKRINLWKGSGISDTTCGRMYEEYCITLPGGFQLPIWIGKEIIYARDLLAMDLPKDTAEHILTDFAEDYLCERMIGGTVLNQNCFLTRKSDIWSLKGDFVCNEMIGRIVAERNGE